MQKSINVTQKMITRELSTNIPMDVLHVPISTDWMTLGKHC